MSGNFSSAAPLRSLRVVQKSISVIRTASFSWDLLPNLTAVGIELGKPDPYSATVAALVAASNTSDNNNNANLTLTMEGQFALQLVDNVAIAPGSLRSTWRQVLNLVVGKGARLNSVCIDDSEINIDSGWWLLQDAWQISYRTTGECPCAFVDIAGQCMTPNLAASTWSADGSSVCEGRQVRFLADLDYYKQRNCTILIGSLQVWKLATDVTELDLVRAFAQVRIVLGGGGVIIQDSPQIVALDFLSSLESTKFVVITGNGALVDARLPNLNNGTLVTVSNNDLLCDQGMPFGTEPCNQVQIAFGATVALPTFGVAALNASTINITLLMDALTAAISNASNGAIDPRLYELVHVTPSIDFVSSSSDLNITDTATNNTSNNNNNNNNKNSTTSSSIPAEHVRRRQLDSSSNYKLNFHISLSIVASAKLAAAITDALLSISRNRLLIDKLQERLDGFENATDVSDVRLSRESLPVDFNAGIAIAVTPLASGVLVRWSMPNNFQSSRVQFRPAATVGLVRRLQAKAQRLLPKLSFGSPVNATAGMAYSLLDTVVDWKNAWGGRFYFGAAYNASNSTNVLSKELFLPACATTLQNQNQQRLCLQEQMIYEIRVIGNFGSSTNVTIGNTTSSSTTTATTAATATSSVSKAVSKIIIGRINRESIISDLHVASKNASSITVQWAASSTGQPGNATTVAGYAASVLYISRETATTVVGGSGGGGGVDGGNYLPAMLQQLQDSNLAVSLLPMELKNSSAQWTLDAPEVSMPITSLDLSGCFSISSSPLSPSPSNTSAKHCISPWSVYVIGIRPLLQAHGVFGKVSHILVETAEHPAQYPPLVEGVLELTSTYARVGLRVNPVERAGVVVAFRANCQAQSKSLDSEQMDSVVVETGLTSSSQLLLASLVTFNLELNHLHPFTRYACELAAATVQGSSHNATTVLEFQTLADKPSMPLQPKVYLVPEDNRKLGVSWQPPLFPGGEIVFYQVWMAESVASNVFLLVYQGSNTSTVLIFNEEEQNIFSETHNLDLSLLQFKVGVVNHLGLSAFSDSFLASDAYAEAAAAGSAGSAPGAASGGTSFSSLFSSPSSGKFAILTTVGAVIVLAVVVTIAVVYRRQKKKKAVIACNKRQFEQFIPPTDVWYIPSTLVAYTQQVLGRGQFGNVEGAFITLNKQVAPVEAAAKTCLLQRDANNVEEFMQEIRTMQALNIDGGHPNVVRLMGVCQQVRFNLMCGTGSAGRVGLSILNHSFFVCVCVQLLFLK